MLTLQYQYGNNVYTLHLNEFTVMPQYGPVKFRICNSRLSASC